MKLSLTQRLRVLFTGYLPDTEDDFPYLQATVTPHRGPVEPAHTVIELRPAQNGKILTINTFNTMTHEWQPLNYLHTDDSRPLSEVLALLLVQKSLRV